MATSQSRRFPPSPIRILTALAGVASVFLPFAFDFSPLQAARQDYWFLAFPALLTLPITAGQARSIAGNGIPKAEQAVGYLLAFIGLVAVLNPWVLTLIGSPDGWDLAELGFDTQGVLLVLSPISLVIGLGLVARLMRMEKPPEEAAITFMRVVYVANAILCLSLFHEDWQAGAWLVLVVAMVYLGVMIKITRKPGVVRQAS